MSPRSCANPQNSQKSSPGSVCACVPSMDANVAVPFRPRPPSSPLNERLLDHPPPFVLSFAFRNSWHRPPTLDFQAKASLAPPRFPCAETPMATTAATHLEGFLHRLDVVRERGLLERDVERAKLAAPAGKPLRRRQAPDGLRHVLVFLHHEIVELEAWHGRTATATERAFICRLRRY